MEHDEAWQHAAGYAAGREDASDFKTCATGHTIPGFMAFADAFAAGWDEYNAGRRYRMVNARDAYDSWQASDARTIFERMTPPPAWPALVNQGTDS